MGAFTDLFGYLPRVKVLEVFAENPDEALSAPDVERTADVSRRAAYLIIKGYVEDGVIVPARPAGQSPRRFQLNQNDLRAQTLWAVEHILTLGGLQAEIKRSRGIPLSSPLPHGIVSRIPRISFVVDWSFTTSSYGLGLVTASTVLTSEPGTGPTPIPVQSSGALAGPESVVIPYVSSQPESREP